MDAIWAMDANRRSDPIHLFGDFAQIFLNFAT